MPQKAIFWEEEQALIVADVHLGKVGHFRKAGIAIPKSMEQEDLAALSDIIHDTKPRSIIFLGDLFHSDMNNDWDWFVLWRNLFKGIRMILIRGNHDIIHDDFYIKLNFELYQELFIEPFLLVHEPLKIIKLTLENRYVLSGHIHPGVSLRGKGKQVETLPCFYFGDKQGILPAFGRFTGKVCIMHEKTDFIFGVLQNKVIPL
ncbi:MAG: metallophosphoesterase [Sphingobacteriales bacterium]|nr:metallophosphoesterase [Sphingobacteriales bacterium]